MDTNEDGSTSTRTDYDYDTLVKSVQSFVSAYNDTLESVGSIEASSVQQKTQWLTQVTGQYTDELAGVGISALKHKKTKGKNLSLVGVIFMSVAVLGLALVPSSFHTVEAGQIAVVKHLGEAKNVAYL